MTALAVTIVDFDGLSAAMATASAEAAGRLGTRRVALSIAGLRVDLAFAGQVLERALLPAVRHLIDDGPVGPPHLTINLWDSASSGVAPPRPDWSMTLLGPRGVIPGLSRPGGYAAFDIGAGVAQTLDVAGGEAFYWTEDAETLPYWERSFPFRQTLAWFFANFGFAPVHAACVAWRGRGLLLPGASGAGKSTTALRLGLEGFDLLGDDYVLLDAGPPCRVWSLYATAKLDDRSLRLLPALAPHALRGRPTDAKAVLLWPTPAGGSIARETAIAATVLPRVSGRTGEDRITAATPGDVLFALAPTTISHLDVPPALVFKLARAAAEAAPIHRLEISSNPSRLAETMRALVEG